MTKRRREEEENIKPCVSEGCAFFGTREKAYLCSEHSGEEFVDKRKKALAEYNRELERDQNAILQGKFSPWKKCTDVDLHVYRSVIRIGSTMEDALKRLSAHIYGLKVTDQEIPLMTPAQATLLWNYAKSRLHWHKDESMIGLCAAIARLCTHPWELKAESFHMDVICYECHMGDQPSDVNAMIKTLTNYHYVGWDLTRSRVVV